MEVILHHIVVRSLHGFRLLVMAPRRNGTIVLFTLEIYMLDLIDATYELEVPGRWLWSIAATCLPRPARTCACVFHRTQCPDGPRSLEVIAQWWILDRRRRRRRQ